jgi:Flp pilus assembly protein TadG
MNDKRDQPARPGQPSDGVTGQRRGRLRAAAAALPDALRRRLPLRDERGVALVEFALIAPVLFLVLLGMLDFGRAMNNWNDVTQLANEGARLAAVSTDPTSAVSSGASNYGLPAPTTSITCSGSKQTGDSVTVQVTVPYTWYVGKLVPFVLPSTLKSSATMRLEQDPTFSC